MEILNYFAEFLHPDIMILVFVTYIVGIFLKSTNVKNELIPLLLTFFAIFMSSIKFISSTEVVTHKDILYIVFSSITQGVLVSGMAVYINQLIKQNEKSKR